MQGILYAACMCQNIIHANGRVKICVWASLEAAATVYRSFATLMNRKKYSVYQDVSSFPGHKHTVNKSKDSAGATYTFPSVLPQSLYQGRLVACIYTFAATSKE